MKSTRLKSLPAILIAHLRQRYTFSLLNRLHHDPLKKLGWSSQQTQIERFRLFSQIGDLNNCDILDIGCGLGDFYKFLTDQGYNLAYTGYDLVPGFIHECKKHFANASFKKRNVLLQPPKKKFDYVFSSGVFAYGNRHFFEEMVKISFDLCNKGYAFNIYESEAKEFFKISKKDTLKFCNSLNPANIVLHDQYMKNDFTIFMLKY